MTNHVAFFPPLTAFVVVLLFGLIAIIIAIVKENGPSGSGFWFFAAYWATCLALLA